MRDADRGHQQLTSSRAFDVFQIKICGITTVSDALLADELGADAIGLNFFPQSRRFVDREQARKIAMSLRADRIKDPARKSDPSISDPAFADDLSNSPTPAASPKLVGVFVNAAIPEVIDVFQDLQLDAAQLHGDESNAYLQQLTQQGVTCIRAIRPRNRSEAVIAMTEEELRQGCIKAAVVDAYHPHEYGGTGSESDWNLLREIREESPELPWILAGGLGPDNVELAIRQCHPWGVDVATGVESSPGSKSEPKMANFIRRAKRALSSSV